MLSRKLKGLQVIYKTVDSTLRGHLAIETSALLEETGRATALVAPAFPQCGRITRGGTQLLGGRPVHETEFACDPTHPVLTSDIAILLCCPGLQPMVTISRDRLHNSGFVREKIGAARCVLIDCETLEDLQHLGHVVADWSSVCWVGSPGLARALAEERPGMSSGIRTPLQDCRRVLVVVGSLNYVSRNQIDYLVLRGDTAMVTVDLGIPVSGPRVAPTVAKAVAEGINASGPWPGDTVFMRARKGEFDVVVAQYHDQGLIPVKYLGVDRGVNVTLGLPFVRTSVDHGTAFDIAGSGRADHASLREALRQAVLMSEAR